MEDWDKGWVQQRDSETLNSVCKRLSAGLFDTVSRGRRSPGNNRRMHIYVNVMSGFIEVILLFYYFLLFYAIFLSDSSLAIRIERIGLVMIMMSSFYLSGYQVGKYTVDPEFPDWRGDGNTMASIHAGSIFLLLGTINLLTSTFVQNPASNIKQTIVIVFLIGVPLLLIAGLRIKTTDVELPSIIDTNQSSLDDFQNESGSNSRKPY